LDLDSFDIRPISGRLAAMIALLKHFNNGKSRIAFAAVVQK
jgi:hypothetical protein